MILTYQPHTAKRRPWRWVAVVLAIGAAALSWANRPVLKKAAARIRERWIVRECENFQLPADTVVYETDPNKAAAYAGNPLYECVNVKPPYLVRHMLPLKNLEMAQGVTYTSANAVFCHWRTSKSGHQRLIVVDGFDAGRPGAMVIDPGSPLTPSTEISTSGANFPQPWHRYEVLSERGGFLASLNWDWKNNPAFTLYAGQPDANDDSHFTFRYAAKTGTGTIDGWLLDNDKVRFRAVDGPFGHPLSYFLRLEREVND